MKINLKTHDNNSNKNIEPKDIIRIQDFDTDEIVTLIFNVSSIGSGSLGSSEMMAYVTCIEYGWFEIFKTNSIHDFNNLNYYNCLLTMLNQLDYNLVEIIPHEEIEIRRI